MLSFIIVCFLNFPFLLTCQNLSDEEIKQEVLEESRREYQRSCPCRYDKTNDGKRCGKGSAYCQTGGEEPKCYPKDVTSQDVEEYRKKLNK